MILLCQLAVNASRRHLGIILAAGLAALTIATFWPVKDCRFLNYDDTTYVTENQTVQKGLTWENVKWAFTTEFFDNWHPITWFSHMLDVQLFGVNPGAHHAMSVFYHTINTILLFFALRALTRRDWESAFVAALFSVHPLHVEAVTWIAERKEILCTGFFFAALWAYASFVRKKSHAFYCLTLGLFALALMAKPMAVTLPFVLLLLDYWPLERFAPAAIRRLLLEKLPFLFFSVASSLEILRLQHAGKEVLPLNILSISHRIETAAIGYSRYLGKTFWPSNLAIFYPYPQHWPILKIIPAFLLLIGVTLLVGMQAKKRPYVLVGWLWFLGTLVPVIGLLQVSWQSLADHYSYLPTTGIFIAVVWAIADLARSSQTRKPLYAGGAAAALSVCVLITTLQIPKWKSSETIFAHAFAVTQDNFVAHINYGSALLEQSRYAEAIPHFEEALRIIPTAALVERDLGISLLRLNRNSEAIPHLRRAVRLRPDYSAAWEVLGTALLQTAPDDALQCFAEAVRIDPGNGSAHYGFGNALLMGGRENEAASQFRKAIELLPSYTQAHNNLAIALTNLGQIEPAIAEFRETLRLRPEHAKAHYNLGSLLADRNQMQEAVAEFGHAKRIAAAAGDSEFASVIQDHIDSLVGSKR